MKAKRPEWTTESGSPSAHDGILDLSAGDTTDYIVSTPSDFFVGTWETDVNCHSTTDGGSRVHSFWLGGSRKYRHSWDSTNGHFLYDDVDGEFVIQNSARTPDVAGYHTLKVTRASGGNWELFYDGASEGTGTDATTTSTDELRKHGSYYLAADCYHDNLKVY